jgi:hypothetical protein
MLAYKQLIVFKGAIYGRRIATSGSGGLSKLPEELSRTAGI